MDLISFLPPGWAAIVGDIVILTTALRALVVGLQKLAARTDTEADDRVVGEFSRVLGFVELLLDNLSVGPTKLQR